MFLARENHQPKHHITPRKNHKLTTFYQHEKHTNRKNLLQKALKIPFSASKTFLQNVPKPPHLFRVQWSRKAGAKVVLLAPAPKTKITFMRPSPNTVLKPLISLRKSLLLLSFISLAVQAKAQTVAEQYLFAAANQSRAAQGLPALRYDRVLAAASLHHAREMAAHAAISHQFNGEPDLAERGANAGAHFSLITENVASASTPIIIHDMWMHSPGHRANLLDPKVDSIGIAVVVRGTELWAVEDFARSVETLTLNQQERSVASVLSQTGLHVAQTTQDARQTCAMSTGYAGSRKPWFVMRYTAASLDQIPSELQNRINTGKYHEAIVGACAPAAMPFTAYNIAVLLYP